MLGKSFRVVRVYHRLPPKTGGMEKHIAELSKAQRALGVNVVNVFNSGIAEGKSVQVLPWLNLDIIRPAFIRNAIFYGAIIMANRRIRSDLPAILHVHGDWSDLLFSKVLARVLGIKNVVSTFHGILKWHSIKFLPFAISHCNLIFTTGKKEQQTLKLLLQKPVHHMPSAPRDIFFSSSNNDSASVNYDVISIANLYPKKRVDLILSCAALRRNLSFLILGDGPERGRLLARIAENNITNITLAGHKPPKDIVSALRRSRLFLSTSEEEGTPTTVLEAMALGLPVVLTPSNNYDWLITSGKNGFVTSSWDVLTICAKMDAVLCNEEMYKAMARNNILLANIHRWSTKAEIMTNLMAEQVFKEK